MKKVILSVLLVGAVIAGFIYVPIGMQRLEQAKVDRTVADVRNVGTAMFSWLTDQVGAAPTSPLRAVGVLAELEAHDPDVNTNRVTIVSASANDPGVTHSIALALAVQSQKSYDISALKRITYEDLCKRLIPKYLAAVPENDGWGQPYEFYVNDNVLTDRVMAIRSAGKDGKFSGAVMQLELSIQEIVTKTLYGQMDFSFAARR